MGKPYKLKYEIEKGMLIQDIQEFEFPFKDMEIGDSFFVPLLDWVSMGMMQGAPAIWECIQKLSPINREYKIRTVKGGFRVWRIA